MYRFAATPRPALIPALVLALMVAGCNNGAGYRSPTNPEVPVPTAPEAPPALPPPPATDVTAMWTGTVSSTYDEGGGCTEPATARLEQSGSAVTGTLEDPAQCGQASQMGFEGVLEGVDIRGRIIFPSFTWPTYGRVDGKKLTLVAFNVRWELWRRR